jgi:hypothetical protein
MTLIKLDKNVDKLIYIDDLIDIEDHFEEYRYFKTLKAIF